MLLFTASHKLVQDHFANRLQPHTAAAALAIRVDKSLIAWHALSDCSTMLMSAFLGKINLWMVTEHAVAGIMPDRSNPQVTVCCGCCRPADKMMQYNTLPPVTH